MPDYCLTLDGTVLYLKSIGDFISCSFTDRPAMAMRLTNDQAYDLSNTLHNNTPHSFSVEELDD